MKKYEESKQRWLVEASSIDGNFSTIEAIQVPVHNNQFLTVLTESGMEILNLNHHFDVSISKTND